MPSHTRAERKAEAASRGGSRSKEETPVEEPVSESQDHAQDLEEPLRLVHHHAGYVRVRAAAFLQADPDNPVLTAARNAAESIPGFRVWSHNPKTGSVVVQYEPGLVEADDLIRHIAKSAGLPGVEVATPHKMSRQEVVSDFLDMVQKINQTVSHLTGGRADLREVGPVALAAISVVSFIVNDNRGRLPQWSSALYHSYRVFMHWHRPEVRTRERTARQEDERNAADETRFSD
ncbi:MAG TPA: hypothetical protein VEF06_06545 [Bryobacteraceae bacterium]|nr:hypothetical protein [Bryobacteraceae bacterium]